MSGNLCAQALVFAAACLSQDFHLAVLMDASKRQDYDLQLLHLLDVEVSALFDCQAAAAYIGTPIAHGSSR